MEKIKNTLIIEYKKMPMTLYGKHAGVFESHKNVKSIEAAKRIVSNRKKSNIVSAKYKGEKI